MTFSSACCPVPVPRPEHGLLLAGCLICSSAGAEVWRSLPERSELRFVARFQGAEVPGVFRRFTVEADPVGDGNGAWLRVSIAIDSADMFSADLNAGIADPEWFDFGRAEPASFSSEQIEPLGDGEYRATGRLQFKCGNQTIQVPYAWRSTGRRAFLRGELTLQRSDYCIGSGEWANEEAIDQAVEVDFDVELAPAD